jgi:hypothetical protein
VGEIEEDGGEEEECGGEKHQDDGEEAHGDVGAAFEGGDPDFDGLDGDAGASCVLGGGSKDGGLIGELLREAGVGVAELGEVGADGGGKGGERGLIGFFAGGAGGEEAVGHGNEPGEVGEQVEEDLPHRGWGLGFLHEGHAVVELWFGRSPGANTEILAFDFAQARMTATIYFDGLELCLCSREADPYGMKIKSLVDGGGEDGAHGVGVGAAAEEEFGDRGQDDGSDDNLRPDAVDAPFFDDVGLEVGEEGGAEEADAGEFEDDAQAAEQREDGDEAVADDSDGGDGDVQALGVGVFIEGTGGEDGVAAVVDGAAVELFGDGAGGGGTGVHVVDAEGQGAVDETGHGKQGDEVFHAYHSTVLDGDGFVRSVRL